MRAPSTVAINIIWLIGLTAVFVAAQGDLTPSQSNGALGGANNPQASMKTLQQIEPRIDLATVPGVPGYLHHITSPGSYYLSGDVNMATIAAAVRISAVGVTLDLNGFEIRRVGGSSGQAIQVDLGSDRCVIKNGSIRGGDVTNVFSYGILVVFNDGNTPPTAHGGVVSDVTVSGCSLVGIDVGHGWVVDRCVVDQSPGSGIRTRSSCIVSNCTASRNEGDFAISTGEGCRLVGCTAVENTTSQVIQAGKGSTLTDCVASSNVRQTAQAYGIWTDDGCILKNCAALKNDGGTSQGYGIRVGAGCTLEHCSASENSSPGVNGYGISTGDHCLLDACSATGNTHTGSVSGHGIRVGLGCKLRACVASDNSTSSASGFGILGGAGSAFTDCIANFNTHTGTGSGHGIYSPSSTLNGCTVQGNSSTGGSSSGVNVFSNSSVLNCRVVDNSNSGSNPSFNNGIGIWAQNATTIKDCTVMGNQTSGIFVERLCLVTGNNCSGHSSNGIHIVLDSNSVSKNLVSDNDIGITVASASGSFVTENVVIQNAIAQFSFAGTADAPRYSPGPSWDLPNPIADLEAAWRAAHANLTDD